MTVVYPHHVALDFHSLGGTHTEWGPRGERRRAGIRTSRPVIVLAKLKRHNPTFHPTHSNKRGDKSTPSSRVLPSRRHKPGDEKVEGRVYETRSYPLDVNMTVLTDATHPFFRPTQV